MIILSVHSDITTTGVQVCVLRTHAISLVISSTSVHKSIGFGFTLHKAQYPRPVHRIQVVTRAEQLTGEYESGKENWLCPTKIFVSQNYHFASRELSGNSNSSIANLCTRVRRKRRCQQHSSGATNHNYLLPYLCPLRKSSHEYSI